MGDQLRNLGIPHVRCSFSAMCIAITYVFILKFVRFRLSVTDLGLSMANRATEITHPSLVVLGDNDAYRSHAPRDSVEGLWIMENGF